MTRSDSRAADVVREYGPFEGFDHVHGLTFDGRHVWFAAGAAIVAFDPTTSEIVRTLCVRAHAGTAFDGKHLYQIAEAVIQKIDPATGDVLATIPAPGKGGDSGLTWAEGSLWVGQFRDRRIHRIDPATGAVLRTIDSDRFVTGVTFVDGDLWHGTFEAEVAEVRRIDASTGDVIDRMTLPAGTSISGLESDGGELLYAGGGRSGKVRAIRRRKPARV